VNRNGLRSPKAAFGGPGFWDQQKTGKRSIRGFPAFSVSCFGGHWDFDPTPDSSSGLPKPRLMYERIAPGHVDSDRVNMALAKSPLLVPGKQRIHFGANTGSHAGVHDAQQLIRMLGGSFLDEHIPHGIISNLL
jgi:hypothetical protein